MIKIYPFPALRAAPQYADKVAAMSTGIEGTDELLQELEDNPFSYLHIIKPHLHFKDKAKNAKVHYPFAKNYFRQMIEKNVIHRIPKKALYIYTQIFFVFRRQDTVKSALYMSIDEVARRVKRASEQSFVALVRVYFFVLKICCCQLHWIQL